MKDFLNMNEDFDFEEVDEQEFSIEDDIRKLKLLSLIKSKIEETTGPGKRTRNINYKINSYQELSDVIELLPILYKNYQDDSNLRDCTFLFKYPKQVGISREKDRKELQDYIDNYVNLFIASIPNPVSKDSTYLSIDEKFSLESHIDIILRMPENDENDTAYSLYCFDSFIKKNLKSLVNTTYFGIYNQKENSFMSSIIFNYFTSYYNFFNKNEEIKSFFDGFIIDIIAKGLNINNLTKSKANLIYKKYLKLGKELSKQNSQALSESFNFDDDSENLKISAKEDFDNDINEVIFKDFYNKAKKSYETFDSFDYILPEKRIKSIANKVLKNLPMLEEQIGEFDIILTFGSDFSDNNIKKVNPIEIDLDRPVSQVRSQLHDLLDTIELLNKEFPGSILFRPYINFKYNNLSSFLYWGHEFGYLMFCCNKFLFNGVSVMSSLGYESIRRTSEIDKVIEKFDWFKFITKAGIPDYDLISNFTDNFIEGYEEAFNNIYF